MDRFDDIEVYCRMLGHPIGFVYCRTMNNLLPCSKILDCHFQSIPIQEYIDELYTAEDKEKIFSSPKPKMNSLLELIEKAKNRT